MKKFWFTIFWTLFALLLAGVLSGAAVFIIAFVGVDTAKSNVPSLVQWSIVVVFFVGAVCLGLFGKLPGTRQRQIE